MYMFVYTLYINVKYECMLLFLTCGGVVFV